MRRTAIAFVIGLFTTTLAHGQCPGDVVPNGVVNGVDLAEVLANWGPCSSCAADTNGDGQVNGIDLTSVLGGWGPCRPIITSMSPSQGHINGGNQIVVSGHFLAGTTSVTVGGNPASDVSVVSASILRITTPPGTLGPATVAVTTSAGTGSLVGGFSYVEIGVPPWATLLQAEPDPSIVIDPALRASIAATGLAWRVRDNASQIEMVLIPPGTFMMGCSPSLQHGCFSDESPVHQVTLTIPYYMGRYEVTQAQWSTVMGFNPSMHQGQPDSMTRPVERVSWNMMQQFVSATGLRLPTEAEWEYAYRAGTTTAFHGFTGFPNGTNDDTLLPQIAWGPSNSGGETHPVGQKLGNGFGLHDMSGNVYEFVNDWYSSTYYQSSPSVDPQGPSSGTYRAMRDGGYAPWGSSVYLRASRRWYVDQVNVWGDGGFRVARNP